MVASESKFASGCLNKSIFNDAKVGLKEMKSQYPDQLLMNHLNINPIRNKLDALFHIIDKNVDILMISEIKLNCSFARAIVVHPIDLTETRKVVEFCEKFRKIYHLAYLTLNQKFILKSFLLKLI